MRESWLTAVAADDVPPSLQGWRQDILRKLRYLVLLLIIPVIVSGILGSLLFTQSRQGLLGAGLLLALVVAAGVPWLADKLRAGLLVGLFLTLTAYGLLSFGRLGISPYFGVLAVVFAVALLGRRAGLLALAVQALLVLLIYGGLASGLLIPPAGMAPAVQLWPLLTTGLNILALTSVLTLVLTWLVDTAERSIRSAYESGMALGRLRDASETLVAAHSQEARRNATLRAEADQALQRQLCYAEALSHCSQALLTPLQQPAEQQAILAQALEAIRAGTETACLAIYQQTPSAANSPPRFRVLMVGGQAVIEALSAPPEYPLRSRLVAQVAAPATAPALLPEIDFPPELDASLMQGNWFGGAPAACFPERPDLLQHFAAQEVMSLLWMPLRSGERYCGQLALADRVEHRDWDEPTIQLLRTAAEMIAAALEGWEVAAALTAREAQIRSIAANLPNGMIYRFIQYADGTVAFPYIDGAIERLTGYTPQQIADQPALLLNTIVESDAARYEAVVAESARNLTIFEFETQRRMADGSLRWVLFYSTPQHLPDGAIIWDGIQMDIGVRKQAEQELERAWYAAETAARAKSEFVAQMSHEIRTPLNTVIGLTTLLLASPLSPAQRDDVETIQRSSGALLTLIDDILDFSKMEAGRLALEYQPFGLRACVEEALDLLAPLADAKHLALRYRPDPALPEMFVGDPARLRQILVNLLSNAVRFTRFGSITVSLDGAACVGDEDRPSIWVVAICVQDTGIGIAAEHLEQIFESFFQVSAATGERYGGTGLGLTISKRLADMMDGQIRVESSPGHGSTFTVIVPFELADSAPPRYLAADQPGLKDQHVLLLVDQANVFDRLAQQLSAWQMLPTVCVGLLSALSWFQAGHLVDVVLIAQEHAIFPVPDLMAQLRVEAKRPALPMVLGTAVSQRGRILGQVDLATTAVLPLPFRPSALHDALSRLLGPASEAMSRIEAVRIDEGMAARFPLRILVAEDNAINQQVAQRLLSKLGYTVDLAATGLEVLEALRRRRYDLVLMDVQMPAMSGTEATRYIRSFWPREQQPRIAAMTAYASEENRKWLFNTGIDDFVHKPVRLEELVRVLHATSQATAAHASERQKSLSQHEALDSASFAAFLDEAGTADPAADRAFLARYANEMEGLVRTLHAALAADELQRFVKSAHTLRGLSLQVGALDLALLCGQLEDGGLNAGRSLLADLDAAWHAVRLALAPGDDPLDA